MVKKKIEECGISAGKENRDQFDYYTPFIIHYTSFLVGPKYSPYKRRSLSCASPDSRITENLEKKRVERVKSII